MKRKAEDNENGVETEENGVRLKVFVMGLLLKMGLKTIKTGHY
jgi:hypothetical protein